MMLSDMGADVLRIERKGAADPTPARFDARGRRTLAVDLKQPDAVELCLELCERADVVFEGNRPGVMERLGLGPDVMLARNERLVYARMTGWGQHGPLAAAAGHDINYIALTGALHAMGLKDKPVAPLNLVGDYGGGSMFLVTGILAALLHARAQGKGQVVDAGMTDGASYLMSLFYGMFAEGTWKDARRANLLDGAAPFYDTYRCADDRWIAIGSIEPQFYALLLEQTGAVELADTPQMATEAWPEMQAKLQAVFLTRTRDEWCEIMEGTDVCFAPVLSLAEAPQHPHNVARKTFVEVEGVVQPAPAPRFSATPSAIRWAPRPIGEGAAQALEEWGLTSETIARFAPTQADAAV